MATCCLFQDVGAAAPYLNTLRDTSTFSGYCAGTLSCAPANKYLAILGGQNNCNTASCYSSIFMGRRNYISSINPGTSVSEVTICGAYNTIENGQLNRISLSCVPATGPLVPLGCYSTIENGNSNKIIGRTFNSVTNGRNIIISSGLASDATPSCYNGVVNGLNQSAIGNGHFIGSGIGNIITGKCVSVIGGGNTNNSAASFGFIGGGFTNKITAIGSVNGDFSVVAGGGYNTVDGTCYSSILGGGGKDLATSALKGNTVSNCYSSIVGGSSNCVSGCYSSISGGGGYSGASLGNCVYGNFSSVGGGSVNKVLANYGVISGGYNNTIQSGTTSGSYQHSFIGGGNSNSIKSNCSAIAGGQVNLIDKGHSNFIGGGGTNIICLGDSELCYGVIGGGYNNRVCSSYSGVLVGACNIVTTTGCLNAIVGGGGDNGSGSSVGNTVSGYRNIIGAGKNNVICNPAESSIIGSGNCNQVSGSYNGVFTGSCNFIDRNFTNTSIVSGEYNCVFKGGGRNFIGSGVHNCMSCALVTPDYKFVCDSSIVGGENNQMIPTTGTSGMNILHAFIGGGLNNYIGCDSIGGGGSCCASVIVGGVNNCVYGNYDGILSGSSNKITSNFSVIGGGSGHTASGLYSSIFSGLSNKVTGACSAILGGSGNCDNGFNWAGISGCNVVAVSNKAFHANTFVAQNICAATIMTFAGLPAGTLYVNAASGAGFLGKPVYIR